MNRRPDSLLPLEAAILEFGLQGVEDGQGSFYAYAMAKELQQQGKTPTLSSNGTMYKALRRLEERRLLASRYEDAAAAEAEGKRPRRTFYQVTPLGEEAFRTAPRAAAKGAVQLSQSKAGLRVRPVIGLAQGASP